MDDALKLDEVAKAAGVSPRTVRYYIQRGLLPQPRFRGPDTAYGQEHVVRLLAIRRLQDAYWPLETIAAHLGGKSESEIQKIADGKTMPALPGASPPASPSPVSARIAQPKEPAHPIARVRRITLAPGLVLELDDQIDEDTEALAERLLALASPKRRR